MQPEWIAAMDRLRKETADKLRSRSEIDIATGCLMWSRAKLPAGYGQTCLPGSQKKIFVHRAAFWAENGYLPVVVRHRCDRPGCVNPEHLVGGTQADNVRDMEDRKRTARGEQIRSAKLTAESVIALRADREAGAHFSVLAAKYGVTKSVASKAAARKTWSHVA